MTRPAIFADLEFDAALEESRRTRKMLLVDATASWCQPCQVMDRTTWAHADVVARIGDVALAVQVDVDAKADVAKRLGIKAMPTVIAFDEGVEVDRIVGLKQPPELLAWLDALARGETSLDAERAAALANPKDMQARMKLARSLFERGKIDEATDAYVWLWEHMVEEEPTMLGVKHSFFVMELQRLVAAHAPARDAFATLREKVAPPASGKPDAAALADWFSLSTALGKGAETLAWFDSVGKTLEADDAVGAVLEQRVVPLLMQKQRWADAGRLFRDPVANLRRLSEAFAKLEREPPPGTPPEMIEKVRAAFREDYRKGAANLVRMLKAAGRADDVRALTSAVTEIDPSEAMATALRDAEKIT